MNKEDICILIPTLNEGKTIAGLVKEFKSLGYSDILVIDGHSTDDTVSKAQNAGARIVVQSGTGKGQAISQAFRLLSSKYIVMIDGDGTYLPEEIHKLLEPVISGHADHVIGNRSSNYQKGAFTGFNLFGFMIGSTIYLLARTHNPLFYFNLIGGLLTITGIIVGIYVVNEWINNITHVPLTIFATLLIVTGILMFIFAILSDLIVSMNRENMRMMRKILKEIEKP